MKTLKLYTIGILIIVQPCVLKQALSQSLLLEEVNVINVEDGTVSENLYVLIKEDRISYLGKKKPNTNQETRKIKANGKYLIPGLWDMHVHLTMVGESSLPLFVLNGITQVRDMGGDYYKLKDWRSRNDWKLPLIKTAGPILESPRFVATVHQLLGSSYSKTRIPVSSPEMVSNIIDSLKIIGVDFVKVRTVDNLNILKAIAEETKANNLAFTGHLPHQIPMNATIELGIATIEHADFLQLQQMTDEGKMMTYQAIEKQKPAFTPTFKAFQASRLTPVSETLLILNDSLAKLYPKRKFYSPNLLEAWSIETNFNTLEPKFNWDSLEVSFNDFAKKIAERTTLLAGTDVGVRGIEPGKGLHEELQLMVEKLDISPLEALRAATINPAQTLGLLNEYGTIEVGKKANLILLNKSPLDNIQHTIEIYAVIKDGKYVDEKIQKEVLEDVEVAVAKARKSYEPEALHQLEAFLKKLKGQE